MEGNPKKELWQKLNESQYYTKSYDEFEKQFSSEESINALYTKLNEAEYYTKSAEDFKKQFFFSSTEPSTQDSKTPSKPLPPSGKEAKIKELTVKATQAQLSGDTATLNTIKAQLDQLNQPVLPSQPKQEVEEQVDLRKVDIQQPTEQRGVVVDGEIVERQKTQTRSDILKYGIDKTQNAYKEALQDEKKLLSVDREELDIDLFKDYQTVNASQILQGFEKGGLEQITPQLANDYLNWLDKTNPEQSKATRERLADLQTKGDLNLQDKQFIINTEVSALDLLSKTEYKKALDLSKSIDIDKYTKDAVAIEQKIKSLNAERLKYVNADGTPKSSNGVKYNEYKGQIEGINSNLESLVAEFNQYVTPEGELRNEADRDKAIKIQSDIEVLQKRADEVTNNYAYLFDENGRLRLTDQELKANDISERINGLIGQYNEIAKQTGVSAEKQAQIQSAIDLGNRFNGVVETLYEKFPDLDEARTKGINTMFATQKFTSEASPTTVAVGSLITNTGKAIESGVLNAKQFPKILSDFLVEDIGVPSKGIKMLSNGLFEDWFDDAANRMYNMDREQFSYAEGVEKPTIVKGAELLGSGLGSVMMFAAGGELASVVNIPKLAGLWGTAFVTQEGSNYQEALDAGLSPQAARLSSLGISGISATVELLVPDFKYLDDATRASIYRAVERGITEGLDPKDAVKKALENVWKDLPKVVEAYGVGMLQEGFEEGVENRSTDLTKAVVNYVEGREIYKDLFDGEGLFEAIASGAMTSGTMTALNRPTKKSPLQQELIGEIANVSPEQVAELSTIAPENAGVIMEIQEVNSGLSKLPSFQALPKVEKNYILSEMMRKKQLQDAMKAAGIKDDATVAEIEKIELGVNAVLNGTPLGSTIELETKEGEPKQTMVVGEEFAQLTSNEDANVESKKADIERRRQEALKSSEINFEPLTSTVEGSWDKAKPINDELQNRFKNSLQEGDKIITGNNETVFFRNGKIVKKDGKDYGFSDIPSIAILKRGAKIDRTDKINAKYDAELAALEQTPTSEVVETPVEGEQNVKTEVVSEVQADEVTMNTQTVEVGQESSPSVQVQEDVQNVQPNVQDALKDVESTAKALENVNYDTYQDENYEDVKGLPLIYRGAGEDFEQVGFYSFDKTEAENYAQGNTNAKVRSAMINPNAKILNMLDVEGNVIPEAVAEYERITGGTFDEDGIGITETMWGDTKDKKKLIKAGYDGIVSYTMDGNAFVSFNPNATIEANPKTISEAYHKAKADGSNPELVQAVESLLGQPSTLQEDVESQGAILQETVSENTQSVEQNTTETEKVIKVIVPKASKKESKKSARKKRREALAGYTPTTIRGYIRQSLVFGEKLDPNSLRKELGLNDPKTGELQRKQQWNKIFGFSKKGGRTVTGWAEDIYASLEESEKNTTSVQEIRFEIIDVLNSEYKTDMLLELENDYDNMRSIEDTGMTIEDYERHKQQEKWYYEQLEEQEKAEKELETLRLEEWNEFVAEGLAQIDEMTWDEIQTMYGEAVNEQGDIDENKFNEIYNGQRNERQESIKNSNVKENSRTTEESKRNQKAERAKQKVNDIAEKLKEKLKAKGIEDLNIKKLGVGSDELIDGLANLVNALIDLGYSASDAIAEVLDSAKDTLGSEELQEAETALKAKITEGVDIDKATSELGVPKDVVENEVIRTLTINPNEAAKNGEKVIDDLNNSNVRVQKVKSLIRALKSAEGLEQSTKDKLNSELGEFYNVLSDKELEAVGEAIIEEYGGLDAVIKDLNNIDIPPFIKVFALGQGIVQARKAEVETKDVAEKEKFADRQVELSDMLDNLVRDYGRAISYLRVLYFQSPLAVVRKLKKEIEAQNKVYGADAKEKAQGILDLLDNAETTIDAFDSLLENADEALKLTIEEQQKEIDKLKTELSKLTKGGKGKTTTKKRKFTREGLKEKIKKARSLASASSSPQRANPRMSAKLREAFSYASGLAVEEGFNKFRDFYSFIRENFTQDEVGLDDIVDGYINATEFAVEDGVDKKNFETREQVDTYLTEVEKLEKEIADKQRQLDIKKKVQAFSRLLSERVNEPAKRKKKEETLRERAKELDAEYNTTAFSEQAEAYIEGKRIEKLAAPAQVLKTIEKGLIEAGFVKEVNGKQRVDWEKIVKGEKNPQKAWEKVEKEIQKILSPQEYMVQAPLLRDLFFANVNDRKVKAVQAELNKIARKGLPLNRAKRKTRAEQLVEMYNTGALSNKKIRQAIAEDLGIVEFTPEEEAYLNDLIESIDKAQQGFEKEILEEELYNFFDSKKKGYVMRNFFESSRGRLLTGLISIGKNLTGVFTATSKVVYDYITANVQSLGKGNTDTQIFRVTKKAQVMAATLAADIWWNGGVDMGSAFSETTGTKEGTPRIRYIEWRKNTPLYEAAGFAKISIMQPITWANRQLNTIEKGGGRTLQAADAYNALNVQETSAYVYIKARLKKAHPEWSNKTLLEKTWEVMYGKTLEDAKAQAEQEYSDRGIILTDSVSDRIRFNRRVYEIIQQARGEAVVQAGQFAANRYTFKAPDVGVGYGVFLGLMSIKKGFNSGFNLAAQSLSKTNPKAADRVRRAGNVFSEIVFTQTLPFIKGVTNILEKRLELFPPYGVAKGIAYTVAAKLNQDNPNSTIDYARAGEYYYRAAVGGLMIMLFKYLADDDEEGFEKIYGTGTPDWRDNATESKVTMQNRIVINGRPFPMQAFGTNDLNLMMLGVIADMGRENLKLSKLDQEKKDAAWFEAGARMTESILRDEYLKGFMNMYKGITSPTDTYWNRTLAEYMTRSVIPATGLVRQTFDMATKEQLKPITFSEHLMKQSGMVGGWLLDRKAYDVLGRTYENGSLYGNSAGSFMNMGSKAPEVPAIDKFLYNYKPIVATKSSENEALDLMDVMGGIRSMDNEEFYEYDKSKNSHFGQLLEAYYNTNPEDEEYKGKMPEASSQAYDKLFKEAIFELNSEGIKVNLDNESDIPFVEEKMLEITQEKAMAKEISKTIGELSNLAYRASFEQFLMKRNLFVPFSVRGAGEEYLKKLESF